MCASIRAPKTFLAYPTNQAEEQALDALAGGITTFWVGIDDLVTSGTWKNSQGGTQAFLPWTNGNPSSGATKDCVEEITQSNAIDNVTCGGAMAAICACE